MVNELFHSFKSSGEDAIAFKVDFSKAYDSINWHCLLHVMDYLNMKNKWSQWIEKILGSSRISVLVNRSPTKEFTPQKGIRQGGSLAPYLFLLFGEVLNRLIKSAHAVGVIKGVEVRSMKGPVLLIQYADDVMFSPKIVHVIYIVLKRCC